MTPAEYKALDAKIDRIIATIGALHGAARGTGGTVTDGAVATDRDLDGDHGDPEIVYDPKEKYWAGESFVGRRFSECSADYLDAMAKYLDACAWGANKDGDTRKAGFKSKDAARARGWAQRVRAGRGAQPARQPQRGYGGGHNSGPPAGGYADEHVRPDHTGSFGGSDDDIPFVSSAQRCHWHP